MEFRNDLYEAIADAIEEATSIVLGESAAEHFEVVTRIEPGPESQYGCGGGASVPPCPPDGLFKLRGEFSEGHTEQRKEFEDRLQRRAVQPALQTAHVSAVNAGFQGKFLVERCLYGCGEFARSFQMLIE